MNSQAILTAWKKGQFRPIYWFEGEEEYFIDELINYAEKKILSEDEAGFNLTVFYGKDADWTQIINSCRRYPAFAEKQVVILKEAQQMRDIDKLESYIEKPLSSTVFVVSYKGKTLDGRTKLARIVKKNGELLQFKRVYDNQLPRWTSDLLSARGLTIEPRALVLLVDHVGNDLARISNEINKLEINISGKEITANDIEKYIGISKEYNIYELQNALALKDLPKAIRILQYFEANPKAAPLAYLFTVLYGFFTKMLVIKQMPVADKNSIRHMFFNNPVLIDQALISQKKYSFEQLEKAIVLLHAHNLKMVGVGAKVSDAANLKELSYKIMTC